MYTYLLSPVIAFVLAQGTKAFLRSRKHKLTWHDFVDYSDMPSSHTATVISLMTIMALKTGLASPYFAISFVLAAVVISDAVGLRNYLGSQGKELNVLVKDLKEDEFLDRRYSKQTEHVGHTPLQVLVGAILGAAVSLILFWLF